MKRKRKTRKTFTDAQKRGLVNEVVTLVTQGSNLTEARSKIALKHKTTPISLARWTKGITNNGVVSISPVGHIQPYRQKDGTYLHVTSVDIEVPGINGPQTITLDSDALLRISSMAGLMR